MLEGSALFPKFVAKLINKNGVKAIWLTASDRLFQNRIFSNSNFYNLGEDEKFLIQKFLNRTLLNNQRMMEEIKQLGFVSLNIESVSLAKQLHKCVELIEIL